MDRRNSHVESNEVFDHLLPRFDAHPYIYADSEMQPPSQPDQDEETVDVLGDDDEFAVVPKRGMSVSANEETTGDDVESGIPSSGNGVAVLQDLVKIPSSAGLTEEPVHASEPARKRGLQGMSEKGKHILGLGLVIIHCITVLSAAQFAKATYSADFSAPFFIVYFRSAWRIVVFPTFMVLKYIQRAYRNKSGKPTPFMKTFTSCETVFGPNGLSGRAFVYPTGLLAILWITVQFAHVFAVKFLNNSIVQALFCSETAICYLLSAFILKTPVYILKVTAVVIALGGVGFMVYSQGKDDLSWEGIAICLIGAVLGSLYMVAFKRFIGKSEDVGKALLLTSTMAAFITVVAWPLVIILYINGVEYWNWDTFPWATVCISSSLTLVSISMFNLCLTLTSPLIMTLSKLLGIPFNYVVDALFWNHVFDEFQGIGCVFIAVGFVGIAMPEKIIAIKYLKKLCGRETVSVPVTEVPERITKL